MVKPKKTSWKEKKIVDICHYYLQNGFAHTIDDISEALGVGRKTFYNRYTTRENSILLALQCSHKNFVERFAEQCQYCNHSVEEMVMLIWEFQKYAQTDAVFFQYDIDNKLFASDETPFKSILESIVQKGLRTYHINEDIDMSSFVDYFFATLSYYVLDGKLNSTVMRYVLYPLLNERGLELLDELDLEIFA